MEMSDRRPFPSWDPVDAEPREHAHCVREAICLQKPRVVYNQERTGGWT